MVRGKKQDSQPPKLARTSEVISDSVSQLLEEWNKGDRDALDKLMPLIYEELRRIARHYMSRQDPGHTLQPAALIHEAYLRIINQKAKTFQNRAHFIFVASRAMRHILVDYARAQQTGKRGGHAHTVSLEEAGLVALERADELVALDEALQELAKLSKRQSSVVELRYFGGLSVEETAKVLGVSPETVMRDWSTARTWLRRVLNSANEA